jgi:hypothetical protein
MEAGDKKYWSHVAPPSIVPANSLQLERSGSVPGVICGIRHERFWFEEDIFC